MWQDVQCPNDRTNRPSILNKALHLTSCGENDLRQKRVFLYSTMTAFNLLQPALKPLTSVFKSRHHGHNYTTRRHLWSKRLLFSEALESDAQTWHLQQHTPAIILSVFRVRRTNWTVCTSWLHFTLSADVCRCQGATLGIILCLEGYFVL